MHSSEELELKLIKALATARVRQNLSYADVAARTGLHYTAISLIERGKRHMTLLVFLKICAALNMDLSVLFADIPGSETEEATTLKTASADAPTLHESAHTLAITAPTKKPE